jgi:hypothetical protein
MFDKIYQEVERDVLLEKIRSKTFNWNLFKQLATSDKMEEANDYANTHLQFLGEGSARSVYILSSGYVLKCALPSKPYGFASLPGVAQNKAEVDIFTNPKLKPIFAQIYDFDKNYRWVKSELVKEANNGHFFRVYGCTKSFFFKILRNVLSEAVSPSEETLREEAHKNREQLNKINYKKLLETYQSVVEATKAGLEGSDIIADDHWGITAGGRIVLLDYGLSSEIWKKLYIGR